MLYALIGNPVKHSKSPDFFNNLFHNQGLDHRYTSYCINDVSEVIDIIRNNSQLSGLNVTSPFKVDIIPFMDGLSNEAKKVKAVNVVKIIREDKIKLIGYNTDCLALINIFSSLILANKRALILGTSGAARAVSYALDINNIPYTFVSRNKQSKTNTIEYTDISYDIITNTGIIINATPLGMDKKSYPLLPYEYICNKHICFDLIYEPAITPFLAKAQKQGATIMNGYNMLIKQAIKSWEIWSK